MQGIFRVIRSPSYYSISYWQVWVSYSSVLTFILHERISYHVVRKWKIWQHMLVCKVVLYLNIQILHSWFLFIELGFSKVPDTKLSSNLNFCLYLKGRSLLSGSKILALVKAEAKMLLTRICSPWYWARPSSRQWVILNVIRLPV